MEPVKDKLDETLLMAWGKDAGNYKWKYFYSNKEDNRLWIKNWNGYYRGRSWILNFAHPKAIWIYIGLVFGIVIGILLMIKIQS